MELFFYVKSLVVSFLLHIFVVRKMSWPHMFDWETHQFILIPRHSSCRQWRAAPFGACLARRITKMAKHSNPVIRSLFISTVRLSLHRRICQNRHILFFCAPSSIVLDGVTLWVRELKHSFLFEIGACPFFLRIFTLQELNTLN